VEAWRHREGGPGGATLLVEPLGSKPASDASFAYVRLAVGQPVSPVIDHTDCVQFGAALESDGKGEIPAPGVDQDHTATAERQ
jgi:hypothetical protein